RPHWRVPVRGHDDRTAKAPAPRHLSLKNFKLGQVTRCQLFLQIYSYENVKILIVAYSLGTRVGLDEEIDGPFAKKKHAL
ncbi:11116_t:CDS:2, partial [Acaulospora colombiana]